MILQYALDVQNGTILTNKWIKIITKKYLSDIENKNLEYYFDDSVIPKILAIISELKHIKGELAGQPIVLESWQEFFLYSIFCWKHKQTNRRRYRDIGLLTGKKQGKTILDSIILLLDLLFEQGGEGLVIAAEKKQAQIAFDNIKSFVQFSEVLQQRISCTSLAIMCPNRGSNIKYKAGTGKGINGGNLSCAIIDEIAELKNNQKGWDVYNFVMSSSISRTQPLKVWTTTAQSGIDSIGYELIQKAKKVLEGVLDEPTWFTMLYCLDEEDDWQNPDLYIKANPNLDISVQKSELVKLLKSAQSGSIADELTLKTLHLNYFTADNNDTWIKATDWKKAQDNYEKYKSYLTEEKLKTYLCCGGMDLSRTGDLSVVTWAFWIPEIEKYYLKHRVYIPEAEIANKLKTDSYLFYKWIKEEWITPIQGSIIDNKQIMFDILQDKEKYSIKELAFDTACIEKIDDDPGGMRDTLSRKLNFLMMTQNTETLNIPTCNMHDLAVLNCIIDPSPVAEWCVSNVVLDKNNWGVKIRKIYKSSHRRVDIATASVMALARLKYYVKMSQQRPTADFSQIKY